MKLLLIRHGQTDWNAEGKLMGQHDAPLNDIGISQAEETSRLLQSVHIDLIVCSPLKRARQTADIINRNRNIPVLYDARVKNRNFGEFSGKTNIDFDLDGFWDYYRNEHYESAENVQDFFERIYSFLDDMIQKYPDKTILVVSHGGMSRVTNHYFGEEIPHGPLTKNGFHLHNCEIATYITPTPDDK